MVVMLGSVAWFAEMSRELVRLSAAFQSDFAGRTLSFQEVFTGVPPAVAGGAGQTCWHVGVVDGQLARLGYGREPAGDCDLTVHVDWAAAVPIAQTLSSHPEYDALRGALVAAGHAKVAGNPGPKAELQQVFNLLHDHLAPITRDIFSETLETNDDCG